MSSFNSNASKFQAENTVNKLFSNILHTEVSSSTSTSSSNNNNGESTNQLLFSNNNNKGSTTTTTKKQKKKQIKQIKKNEERQKAFNKFVKYTHIKNKVNKNSNDEKYLRKLIRKNIRTLQQGSKIDDFEISEEFNTVSAELLDDIKGNKGDGKRLRKKLFRMNMNKSDKESEKNFEEKLQKGVISYPGLTPGLAPVDYNEDDDSE